MATYQRPGVFIEESLQPLVDPAIASGDYVAAFVGTSLRGGPVGPTLVSSWTQFQSLFGDIRTSPDDLHYAVWQYFANGGHLAYIARGINTDATAASLTINDTHGNSNEIQTLSLGSATAGSITITFAGQTTGPIAYNATAAEVQTALEALSNVNPVLPGDEGGDLTVTGGPLPGTITLTFGGQYAGTNVPPITATPTGLTGGAVSINTATQGGDPALKVTASSPGSWASDSASPTRIYVTVEPSTDGGRFDLTVEAGTGGGLLAREQFVDLTLDPTDPRNAIAIVNSPTVGSKYVTLEALVTWVDATSNPASATTAPLTGGTDGTGSPDLVAAAKRLETIDTVLTLNVPGGSVADVNDVVTWAATRSNIFVVADGPKPGTTDTATEVTADLTTYAGNLPASSYVAVYGPWLYLSDPASSVPGAMRLVPPGGAVIGQYALNDASRGVHKAPAGLETGLRSVLGAQSRFNETQLDTLNQKGVNVIRQITGAGFCIMGARTLNTRMPDRYINIRRSLISLSKSLRDLTRFAIFEPNNSALWEHIEAVVKQFLIQEMQSGLLKGSTQDTAFFVKCDAENNPASSQNAGIVNIEVGVALNSPAEFIIIRIGQYDGGATTEIAA
jgi:phage tail sheath protein FI